MPEPTIDFRTWIRQHLFLSNSRQAWEDRLAVLTLALGGGLLWFLAGSLALSWQVVLWGLLVVFLALLLRQGWLRLFGPVLFWDLVRVARRRRYYLARCAYIAGLSLLLCQFYWTYWVRQQYVEGRISLREQAAFAETFFYTFMWVQFLAVAVLTPAYTASAIADEKERKTLEFLLATDLHNREIILGKWFARVANLALLIVGGLPILALNLFMGGVDPDLMVAGFAATALTMFGLAGVSILVSVYARRTRDAIVLSFLVIAAYYALSTMLSALAMAPIGFGNQGIYLGSLSLTVLDVANWLAAGNIFMVLFNLMRAVVGGGGLVNVLPRMLGDYAIFHGLLTLGTVGLAVARLRQAAIKQQAVKALKRGPRLIQRAGVGTYPPMLWKEVFADVGRRSGVGQWVIMLLLVAVSFVPLILMVYFFLEDRYTGRRSFFDSWERFGEAINVWVRIAGMLVACLILLGVGVRAATAVSGERDKQTLDSLLTTPLTSNEILWSKWLGSLTGLRWGIVWIGLIWVIGAAANGLQPLLVILLVAAWSIYAGVIALIGLWFSLVCKTSLRATMWALVTTLGCTIGHWVLWFCCLPFMIFTDRAGAFPRDLFDGLRKMQMGLSPPITLSYMLPWRGEDFATAYLRRSNPEFAPPTLIGYAVFGMFVWALAGVILAALLQKRFQQQMGREPLQAKRLPPRPHRA